jgi:hypothetical protein
VVRVTRLTATAATHCPNPDPIPRVHCQRREASPVSTAICGSRLTATILFTDRRCLCADSIDERVGRLQLLQAHWSVPQLSLSFLFLSGFVNDHLFILKEKNLPTRSTPRTIL